MGRRFVDAVWIRSRMQAKDDRCARDLRRRFPAAFLAPEIVPFASVEIVPAPNAEISDVERLIEDRQRGR